MQEAQSLTDDHYYNPNWGYQDGEKRNANVSNDHKPIFILSDYWKPNEKTKVNTSLLYTFGRDGYTALNWYDAPDPRPDYYRYLPSYYSDTDPGIAADLTNAWHNDPNASQINWNQLYFTNTKNLYTMATEIAKCVNGHRFDEVLPSVDEYKFEEQNTTLIGKACDCGRFVYSEGKCPTCSGEKWKIIWKEKDAYPV